MEEEERSGSERTGVDEGKREDQERVRKRERASDSYNAGIQKTIVPSNINNIAQHCPPQSAYDRSLT